MCLYSRASKVGSLRDIFGSEKNTYLLVNWLSLTASSTDSTKFGNFLWFDEDFYMSLPQRTVCIRIRHSILDPLFWVICSDIPEPDTTESTNT